MCGAVLYPHRTQAINMSLLTMFFRTVAKSGRHTSLAALLTQAREQYLRLREGAPKKTLPQCWHV
jgi:hypothetical protein